MNKYELVGVIALGEVVVAVGEVCSDLGGSEGEWIGAGRSHPTTINPPKQSKTSARKFKRSIAVECGEK